jgi:tetratricopeptide (TPR) repeat protein
LWLLYAIALIYTLSVVVFYVFARYRFPLVPVLILFAAGGLAAWRDQSARPMRRWAFAALVLAGGLTYLPLVNSGREAHYVNIANAFLKDPGTWDQAVVFYRKAVDESPRSPAAHFGIAVLLTRMQRPQEALAHYRTAVDGWHENVDLRLNFARALEDVGDNERALEELAAAARLRAKDATIHAAAGQVLLKLSRPSVALIAYEEALAIQPANLEALIGSGAALTQLQRPDEAIEKYRLALKVDPRNADARNSIEKLTEVLHRNQR